MWSNPIGVNGFGIHWIEVSIKSEKNKNNQEGNGKNQAIGPFENQMKLSGISWVNQSE